MNLDIFVRLWSLAFFLSWAEAWSAPGAGFFAAVICILSFFAGTDKSRATLLLVLFAVSFYFYPEVANHVTFLMWVSLFAGLALLINHQSRTALLRSFLFIVLAMVYLIAGLHKLNSDFLTPQISCAVTLITKGLDLYGIRAQEFEKFMFWPVVAIVIELACGFLILVRRTRKYGVILALIFHLLLALIGFVDFSSLVLAIVGACYLPSVKRRIVNRYCGIQLCAGLINFFFVKSEWSFQVYFMQVAGIVVFGVYIIYEVASSGDGPSLESRKSPFLLRALLGAGVFVIGLNGVSNYLGLGTANSFSMFSNLRTEGSGWNHLFLPSSLKVFSYQDEIYLIKKSNPLFLELHHEDQNRFEKKLLLFRQVQAEVKWNRCRW